MIVEDERDNNEVVDLDYEQNDGVDNPALQVLREQSDGFMAYIQTDQKPRNSFSTPVEAVAVAVVVIIVYCS